MTRVTPVVRAIAILSFVCGGTLLASPSSAQPTAPGAPVNLAATAAGSAVTITWTAASSGGPATTHIVEAGSAPGLSNVAIIDTHLAAPPMMASAVPNGLYYVRLRAQNAAGTSAPSNEVAVLVGPCTTAPGAPSGLTSQVSGNTVSLSWQAPGGGCAPSGYVIEAGSASGLSNLAVLATGVIATSFSTTNVPNGQYFVRVRGSNPGGAGAASNEISLTVGTAVCTGAPGAPAWIGWSTAGTAVTLKWTAPSGSAASYVVEAGSAPGLNNLAVADTGSAARIFTASAPAGTYYLRVRARNACGTSGPSFESTMVVGGAAPGGLFADSTTYAGPFPTPATVPFTDPVKGLTSAAAFPGQVQVLVAAGIAAVDARAAIEGAGGVVLGQTPATGTYLAGVSLGAESAFITAMNGMPQVLLAQPHMVGVRAGEVRPDAAWQFAAPAAAPPPATLLESCDTDPHYLEVKDALILNGGTFGNCRTIMNSGNGFAVFHSINQAIIAQASENNGAPTLINLSTYGTVLDSGGHLFNGRDWFAQTPAVQQDLLNAWFFFMRVTLHTIAQLPANLRKNLILTVCAGNNDMPLQSLMDELRADPKLAPILRDNVVVVATTLSSWNFSSDDDPDVLNMNNADAVDGTSFAAPAALAMIQRVMASTGASAAMALKALKQAAAANANHEIVLNEAVSAAEDLLVAEGTDPPGASLVTAIALTGHGTTTTAVITPVFAGVTVRFTVSGTDGYFDSGTLKTNTSGRVSFGIPPGAHGVVDTISVTAVVSGRIAGVQHLWRPAGSPAARASPR